MFLDLAPLESALLQKSLLYTYILWQIMNNISIKSNESSPGVRIVLQ